MSSQLALSMNIFTSQFTLVVEIGNGVAYAVDNDCHIILQSWLLLLACDTICYGYFTPIIVSYVYDNHFKYSAKVGICEFVVYCSFRQSANLCTQSLRESGGGLPQNQRILIWNGNQMQSKEAAS